MRIEQVTDEAGLREWYAVASAAHQHDRPGIPNWTFTEIQEMAFAVNSISRDRLFVGRDHTGTAVGAHRLRLRLLDNLDVAEVLLTVHPDHRRRGHGRRLLDDVVQRARLAGRTRLVSEVHEPLTGTGAAATLAAAVGATRALAETHRVLHLDSLDPQRLAALEAETQRHAAGYELIGWTHSCPEELVAAYAALLGRMSIDAPMDDLAWEPEVYGPEQVREREQRLAAQHRRQLVTAVRHLASGELVAYSDLGVNDTDVEHVFQWDTLVVQAHRGHRLGMLVKLANLRRIRAELPQARVVHTWNADSNTHIVAINESLGFVPLERTAEWELRLP